jgi:hypothetical protein
MVGFAVDLGHVSDGFLFAGYAWVLGSGLLGCHFVIIHVILYREKLRRAIKGLPEDIRALFLAVPTCTTQFAFNLTLHKAFSQNG